MEEEAKLRDKLRKIEALFSGTTSTGEKLAAAEAIKRIKEKLQQFANMEQPTEFRIPLPDRCSRKLFIALCRRYGLKPYRYSNQRESTIMVKSPKDFLNKVLWPEFNALDKTLTAYLDEVTKKIIKEEIYGDITDPNEIHSITELK